ncbi:amino acid permease [Spiroplasma taiwanense]|uniref:Amino acid permease n=1 Tax=Spiroplasma taiwanense CT-1 TaxID=1276220 RepID=S5M021_9MOLU|nr:amino acid permease [Spiroplasma taiwanense]AGR41352.1 amino acid permease [Spiroplasma taiwanense CT-1]
MKTKKMGFWTVLALTLTATIGTSIIVTYGSVSSLAGNNPLLMIFVWIIGGIIILPETFLMVEPAISFQENGTAYSWLRRANWKVMAFWFGWVLTLFVSAVAIATASLALTNIIRDFSGYDNEYLWKFISILILFFIGGTQIFIKNSSQVSQIIFMVLKSFPIAFILILALVYGTSENLLNSGAMKENLSQAYIGGTLLIPAITMTMFSYSGTEIPTYVTAEIKNAEKTTPKVILAGVGIVMLVYVLYAIAILSIGKVEDGFLNGFALLPKWATIVFNSVAIVLFIGGINAYLVYQTSLVQKMSEEKDLSHHFLKLSKWSGRPMYSMLLLMAIASIYIMFNEIRELLGYFSLAVSSLKILMTTNIVYLRLKDQNYKKIYKNWLFWVFVVFSYITCILTLIGSFMLLLTGIELKDIWKPIVMILLVILLVPVGFLKYHIQNKLQKAKNPDSDKSVKILTNEK